MQGTEQSEEEDPQCCVFRKKQQLEHKQMVHIPLKQIQDLVDQAVLSKVDDLLQKVDDLVSKKLKQYIDEHKKTVT